MKIIISESQHNILSTKLWIQRRYELVKREFESAIDYTDPCSFDTFGEYERVVISYVMDGIHPDFYLLDNFDYNEAGYVISESFRPEMIKRYFNGRKNCE